MNTKRRTQEEKQERYKTEETKTKKRNCADYKREMRNKRKKARKKARTKEKVHDKTQ